MFLAQLLFLGLLILRLSEGIVVADKIDMHTNLYSSIEFTHF